MRRLNVKNINTARYFDRQFTDKAVDMENTLRQDKYLEILSGHEISTLVELGCGVSAFLPKASEKYRDVWGLDLSSKAVEKMSEAYPKITFVEGSAVCTEFDDEQFDAVVSGELLEHLETPQDLVDEMARICRIGGVMLLSTPHLEFNDPEHLWEMDELDLKTMFSPYGRAKVLTLESEKFPGRKYLICHATRQR